MLTENDKIKHLYNRAGFGLNLFDLKNKTDWQKACNLLFKSNSNYKKLEAITLTEVQVAQDKMKNLDKEDKKDLKQLLRENVFELNNLWLNEMIYSEAQLQEKMALFWHGHFACRSINPYFDQQYLDIIRKNALGNFGTLLNEVSKTPAMLQFLNNQQNKKDHPNENFAREVMELFTLGRGNYTEQDVKEAARAFTGFGFNKLGEFKFRVQQHDFGNKIFMQKTGNFSGEDILKIILDKKECAYFITKKLYKFFVNDTVNDAVVQSLSDKFYQSNYDIKTLMKEIFASDWFYNEKNVSVKIKSPIELMVGMFRTINTTFVNTDSNLFIQRTLGQILLNPPNVAGWTGNRSWIDSSSLLFRMRLPQVIYYDKDIDISPKEITPEMGTQQMKMANDFVKKLASKRLNATADWTNVLQLFSSSKNIAIDIPNTLLAKKADAVALKAIQINADNSSLQTQIKSIVIETMSLPDYQLC